MWVGFLIYLAAAILTISTLWRFCGARSRKYPVLLLMAGFLVAITGVFLIWASENWSVLVKLLCDKKLNAIQQECSLDSTVGGLTVKLIEFGFAALGAGLMGLAFDIKTKYNLDEKRKSAKDKLERVKEKDDLWKQQHKQLGKDLDSLHPTEKVKRYKALVAARDKIFDDMYDAQEEVNEWI